jgi:DNA-directed RNA polymerase specialized sigma24 family protein
MPTVANLLRLVAVLLEVPTAARLSAQRAHMTTGLNLDAFFQSEREWLSRQVGMQPWSKGCAMLVEHMNRWLAEYSTAYCSNVVRPGQPRYEPYLRRIWTCWKHHWKDARAVTGRQGVDGREVARRILKGRGYAGAGRLQGKPFREVVLSQAVQDNESPAAEYFLKTYRTFAIGVARRQDPNFASDPDAWWNEFFAHHLVGYTRSPEQRARGKLSTFDGRSGMRPWLRTVVKLCVWGQRRRGSKRQQPDRDSESGNGQHESVAPEGPPPELRECQQLLVPLMRESLDTLSAWEQFVVWLVHCQHEVQTEIAAIFGTTPPKINRTKQGAVRRMRSIVLQKIRERRDYKDCVELITDGKNEDYFVQVLVQVLEGCGEELRP